MSTPLTVYMDESGFTGEDLANREQPVFVHVSMTLSDAEVKALHTELFSWVQAPELKHKKLAKSARGQDASVRLVQALQGTGKCTVWVCHKQFALLTYLVDLWVEPAMHLDGLDLYQDGANLGLCNMAYYGLRAAQGEQYLSKHLRRFQHMMIERTPQTYEEFWDGLLRDYHSADSATKRILTFFLGGEMKLGYPMLLQMPKRALDPAFTTAVQTCAYWRQRSEAPLRLVHDNSSNLAKDRELWDFVTSPNLEPRTIGIPGRTVVYPMNVTQTEFADSQSHLQLQFCDLIAGATAAWSRQFMRLPHDEAYARRLGKAGIEELRIGAIWPEPEVDPEALGMKGWTGEPVEFLTDQLAKSRGGGG